MKPVQITEDIFWIGGLDPTLEIFDIIMETEYGTTYNSYLVKGDKIAIIETVKEKFFDEYLAKISETINPQTIDYIILNHTEPDHAGSLRQLLEHAPKATVICSPIAKIYLREMLNQDFKVQVVKHGDSLDLGQGKILKFIHAPMLHWPDSMYSYLEAEKTIFTCDSYGCHYSEGKKIFDDQIEDQTGLLTAQRYYFEMIMGPFSNYVISAYQEIKDLEIEIICPGHGPILRSDPWKVVNLFKQWAEETLKINPKGKIFIGYVSAYGYTERMAQTIKEELSKAELTVNMLDLRESTTEEIYQGLINAEAILIGSPTINQNTVPPIWETLALISPITQRGKVAGAFGSYGWSGEAVKMISNQLKALKLKVIDPVQTKFVPSKEALAECRELAKKVVACLK